MYDLRAKQKLCIFIHFCSSHRCCYCLVWCCHCVAFSTFVGKLRCVSEKGPLQQCEFVFQDKCDEYWPERGTTTTYGHVTVTSQQEEERADFVIRTFILKVKVVRTKMELADLHFPQESNLLSIIKLQKWNDRNWPTCFVLFSSRNFRFYVLYHALCQRVIYFTAIIFLSDTSICQT